MEPRNRLDLVGTQWEGVMWYNLTPHVIRIYAQDGVTVLVKFPKSGLVVRVAEEVEELEPIGSIPCVHKQYGSYEEIVGLPPPFLGKKPVKFIVSTPILEAAEGHGRTDLAAPDDGPDSAVRDTEGTLLGVRRWKLNQLSPK